MWLFSATEFGLLGLYYKNQLEIFLVTSFLLFQIRIFLTVSPFEQKKTQGLKAFSIMTQICCCRSFLCRKKYIFKYWDSVESQHLNLTRCFSCNCQISATVIMHVIAEDLEQELLLLHIHVWPDSTLWFLWAVRFTTCSQLFKYCM